MERTRMPLAWDASTPGVIAHLSFGERYDAYANDALSRSVLLGAIAWIGLALPASGQACASSTDSVAFYLRSSMRRMSAAIDPEWAAARLEYQVPQVDSATIVAVTQSQTCQKILAAFNAATPISPAPTRIYAVKVGTVYVAAYPTADTHDWPMTVLDSKFKLLTKFAM